MHRLSTKILKFVLSIGVGIWFAIQSFDGINTLFSAIFNGLCFASLTFIGASIYGIAVDITLNYLLAAIFSLGFIFFSLSKFDEWFGSNSTLEEFVFLAIIVIGLFFMLKDIVFIKNCLAYENAVELGEIKNEEKE